jgi:hypothetical protein
MSPFTNSCPQPGDYAIRYLGAIGYSVRRVTADDAWPLVGTHRELDGAWALAIQDVAPGTPRPTVWHLRDGHVWESYRVPTRESRLAEWAQSTLLRLEATIEWSADLLADIAADAQRAGLADTDDDGLFRVVH